MSSEGQGHNACLWKGLDLSNNVCEYEVKLLTNEKDIKGKRKLLMTSDARPLEKNLANKC